MQYSKFRNKNQSHIILYFTLCSIFQHMRHHFYAFFRPQAQSDVNETQHGWTSTTIDMKRNGASRSQGALINMRGRKITGSSTKCHSPLWNGIIFLSISFSFITLTSIKPVSAAAADDNHRNRNDDLIQGFSLGPEMATTEFGKCVQIPVFLLTEPMVQTARIVYSNNNNNKKCIPSRSYPNRLPLNILCEISNCGGDRFREI